MAKLAKTTSEENIGIQQARPKTLWVLLAEFSIASSDWCGEGGGRRIDKVLDFLLTFLVSYVVFSVLHH
jgi:hypothetical protein